MPDFGTDEHGMTYEQRTQAVGCIAAPFIVFGVPIVWAYFGLWAGVIFGLLVTAWAVTRK